MFRRPLSDRRRRSSLPPKANWTRLAVEPLEARRLLAVDFGDAPDPYPTTLADDGARHEAIGPMLGGSRDEEADGQPTSDANGDGADEDGVTFGSIRVGQLDASVTVNIQNAPTGAKLDAWIDFNGDGSWGGPGEQIADTRDVREGDNTLMFDVPSWAASAITYARFRLSTEGDLGVGGLAADGEVEDYHVTINPPATAPGRFVGQNTISTEADRANSVFAADVDGDGDVDVLSAGNNIAWYENDGNENFTAHTISTVGARRANSVFAADVDGDGDMDVLIASDRDNKIAWYENDGRGRFTAHTISTDADTAVSVFAADLDGDGDVDVLSASRSDDKIAWYENDGKGNFIPHIITTAAGDPLRVFAADLDGDGDLDVISADDDKIAWYENLGSRLRGDLTGNGFVDFEDLTILLAAWNENVSAAEGNLVDADGTPVNFEDLTELLAAWTGPGAAGAPVGRRFAAAQEASTTEVASFESDSDSEPEAPRRATAYESRRAAARSRPASGTYALRRLQSAAVDRVLAEDAIETMLDRRSLRSRK